MFIFSPKLGINQLLQKMGLEGPLWLMDTKGFIILPMWVIAFVALWQYVGQSMMLYMAQISGIDKSLYEASYIDGCTKIQTFRHITLPLIKPMVGTAMSLNAIGSLKFFDLIFNMTEGGPNHKTEVLATHLYTQGFKYFKDGYEQNSCITGRLRRRKENKEAEGENPLDTGTGPDLSLPDSDAGAISGTASLDLYGVL